MRSLKTSLQKLHMQIVFDEVNITYPPPDAGEDLNNDEVTVQYMVAEAQYGGRITDDLDRELFNTYTAKWFCRWAKAA
eukprot:Skav221890  [mRNA]  locus=scaffold1395:579656:581405:+ [translate_table: standard]